MKIEDLNYITNKQKDIRVFKKNIFIGHAHSLYKVKRNNKIFFIFKDTTPLSFYYNKFHSLKEWSLECAWTFHRLPELPKPFSASEYAKKSNISHVSAKKILRKQYWKYIQLDKWYFIENPKCTYFLFKILINSKHPRSLISAINKIREFPLYLEPIKINIEDFITAHSFSILVQNSILKKIRIPYLRKYYYFVPSFFIY